MLVHLQMDLLLLRMTDAADAAGSVLAPVVRRNRGGARSLGDR